MGILIREWIVEKDGERFDKRGLEEGQGNLNLEKQYQENNSLSPI